MSASISSTTTAAAACPVSGDAALRLEAVDMASPAWEVITDDVLVPRRTRHGVVASDVMVFGRKRRITRPAPADMATAASAVRRPASAVAAGPMEKRARTASEIKARDEAEARILNNLPKATAVVVHVDPPQPKPTNTALPTDEPKTSTAKPSTKENPAAKENPATKDSINTKMPSKPKAPKKHATEPDPTPVSYGALAALDEGMARAHKHSRKRARDAQTLLKRAVGVGDVKFFNRLIRDFGNDKQLGFAEEAFRRIVEVKGLKRNVYSHTNMLNACVRVGELDKARVVWSNMLAEKNADMHPNEVTYTVFIKGLAQNGELDEATALLEKMCAHDSEAAPNVRTFSTLLRNCVRHADGINADRCFELMRDAGVTPDAASFEYLIKTKCAAFDAVGAWSAHAEMEREYLDATPQALAALATVSSITGDVTKARAACVAAKTAIEANGAGVVLSTEGSDDGGLFRKGLGSGSVGMDDDDDDVDDDFLEKEPPQRNNDNSGEYMSESVRAFLRLRNSDAARQVAEVEEFLGKGDTHVNAVAADVNNGHDHKKSPVAVVEGTGDRLDFSALFGNGGTVLPTKLEVCSGMGDWVVNRSIGDKSKCDWLAIEMRRNRVRMTWAKGVRARLTNLAVLRGMAHEMISSRVNDETLTEVHVNYPDPPEWVGSKQCLVDFDFLKETHRALRKEDGYLTLVTDDPGYAMRMCRELSKVPELFTPTAPDGKPFVAGVPENYGGSYFDEMWKNGRQTDRYYMRYKAVKSH
tara:strand:- start:550 stop:2823 length:2274 start_codon:yes stop_codon:yes gene_type:complete